MATIEDVAGWRAQPARAMRAYPAALVAVAVMSLAAGYLATRAGSAQAVADAGWELTRLLRSMAVLKVAMATAALWVVGWRLRFPVGVARAGAYFVATAAMGAGPGLIWTMTHVAAGAALLHGGLFALVALGWTDRGMRAALDDLLRSRRARA